MNNLDPKALMEAKAKIMISCFLWGIVLLLIWFLIFIFLGDWAFSVYSQMFRMTHHEFDLINYCGMMAVKLVLFFFFLIPYIAIKRAIKRL